ncbi:hypothetical protein CBM2587_A230178 [Cupriavidus taiwanensis]|uniref:Uncharacterized protein n=1 Tax=Cupriavidus taiwanensis TaxID=164546 RepID=A0A975X1K1_9BURK|nr:hypothetical protein CBM2587_A230178 [Cupriavidus taiwanensis]
MSFYPSSSALDGFALSLECLQLRDGEKLAAPDFRPWRHLAIAHQPAEGSHRDFEVLGSLCRGEILLRQMAEDFLVREVLIAKGLLPDQCEERDALPRGQLAKGMQQIFSGHRVHSFVPSGISLVRHLVVSPHAMLYTHF